MEKLKLINNISSRINLDFNEKKNGRGGKKINRAKDEGNKS